MDRRVPRRVVLAVTLALIAAASIAFLSIPDTEGVTVLLGALAPLLGVAAADRLPAGPRLFAAATAVLAAALAAATAWGAAGRLSVSGWWIPKLLAGAVLAASVTTLAARRRWRRDPS